MDRMDLSIVIVNWNSKDYLQKCLATIFSTIHDIEFEVLVIDNASFDGSDEVVTGNYPKVRYVQSKENIGFAKANNQAFLASTGRNILFLNPDTELEPGAVNALYDQLESLVCAGMVGAKLLNTDRSIQTTCIRTYPTILNQLLDSNALRNYFPRSGLWGMTPLFSGNEAPGEVDAISGACIMTKRSVFETVGMFSDDYFMYSEDIDLCHKVREAGYGIYYVPAAVVVHHGGGSSSQNSVNTFSSVMMLESRWRFFRKTRSLGYCLLYRLSLFISSVVRIVAVLFLWPIYKLGGRRTSPKNVLDKWTARLGWTLGGQRWVRNH